MSSEIKEIIYKYISLCKTVLSLFHSSCIVVCWYILPIDAGDVNHHINHVTAQLIRLHVNWTAVRSNVNLTDHIKHEGLLDIWILKNTHVNQCQLPFFDLIAWNINCCYSLLPLFIWDTKNECVRTWGACYPAVCQHNVVLQGAQRPLKEQVLKVKEGNIL